LPAGLAAHLHARAAAAAAKALLLLLLLLLVMLMVMLVRKVAVLLPLQVIGVLHMVLLHD
jgi:hypothetical protein